MERLIDGWMDEKDSCMRRWMSRWILEEWENGWMHEDTWIRGQREIWMERDMDGRMKWTVA